MIEYPNPKELLLKKFLEEVESQMTKNTVTEKVANEYFAALKVAEIFGFKVTDVNVSSGLVMATMRDAPSCSAMLPVFEYLESQGFEVTSNTDYPTIHNRDFYLEKDEVKCLLSCYFTDKNCRKVPIGSTVSYRLECGVTDGQETQD